MEIAVKEIRITLADVVFLFLPGGGEGGGGVGGGGVDRGAENNNPNPAPDLKTGFFRKNNKIRRGLP